MPNSATGDCSVFGTMMATRSPRSRPSVCRYAANARDRRSTSRNFSVVPRFVNAGCPANRAKLDSSSATSDGWRSGSISAGTPGEYDATQRLAGIARRQQRAQHAPDVGEHDFLSRRVRMDAVWLHEVAIERNVLQDELDQRRVETFCELGVDGGQRLRVRRAVVRRNLNAGEDDVGAALVAQLDHLREVVA